MRLKKFSFITKIKQQIMHNPHFYINIGIYNPHINIYLGIMYTYIYFNLRIYTTYFILL